MHRVDYDLSTWTTNFKSEPCIYLKLWHCCCGEVVKFLQGKSERDDKYVKDDSHSVACSYDW